MATIRGHDEIEAPAKKYLCCGFTPSRSNVPGSLRFGRVVVPLLKAHKTKVSVDETYLGLLGASEVGEDEDNLVSGLCIAKGRVKGVLCE